MSLEKQILEFLTVVKQSSVFRIEKLFNCSLFELETLRDKGIIKINEIISPNSPIVAKTVSITKEGREAILRSINN